MSRGSGGGQDVANGSGQKKPRPRARREEDYGGGCSSRKNQRQPMEIEPGLVSLLLISLASSKDDNQVATDDSLTPTRLHRLFLKDTASSGLKPRRWEATTLAAVCGFHHAWSEFALEMEMTFHVEGSSGSSGSLTETSRSIEVIGNWSPQGHRKVLVLMMHP